MATIGTFTQTQTGFTGEITTLTIQAKKVAIVAETERGHENAPTHRIYLGKAEIRAGWAKVSKGERDYISVKIDDPSLPAPLYGPPLRGRRRQDPLADLDPLQRPPPGLTPGALPPRPDGRGRIMRQGARPMAYAAAA